MEEELRTFFLPVSSVQCPVKWATTERTDSVGRPCKCTRRNDRCWSAREKGGLTGQPATASQQTPMRRSSSSEGLAETAS